MITGMAALEYANLDPDYKVNCSGRYWKKPFIKCWSVHGKVNYNSALAVSCNTYFQYAGEVAGIDNIVEVGKQFGLGDKTGARDIDGENSGLLPSPGWKKEYNSAVIDRLYKNKRQKLDEKYGELIAQVDTAEEIEKLEKQRDREINKIESQYKIDYNFGTNWQPFDTYNTAIGQGANQYTVLQLANYVATLANGEKRLKPFLVKKIISPEG
jgi:penicillin-binding protein 2